MAVEIPRRIVDRAGPGTWMRSLAQDWRFGVRILWQAPGVSAAVVVLVALVIGGNAAVYSAVRILLTAPARGVAGDRLVGIGEVSASKPQFDRSVAFQDFRYLAEHATSLDRLTAWSTERSTVDAGDGTSAVFTASVTPGYFETLGVDVTAGRTLHGTDPERGPSGAVAVISDQLWRERFDRASDIVGRRLVLNGQPATVVGVAAAGFRGASLTPGEDVWVPMAEPLETAGGTPRNATDRRPVFVVGQLAAERTREDLHTELELISGRRRSAAGGDEANRRSVVFEYSATAFLPLSDLAPRFLAAFGLVTALTLLVVSANVANLMLARAVARHRETAVRRSLGASGGRIVRMLVAEGVTLSTAAWAIACAFAWAMSRLLVQFVPPARDGLAIDLGPDWQVVAYAMTLAVIATVGFSAAPALATRRQPVLPWLRSGERAIAAGRSRLSSALVIAQVAFAVLLLTGTFLGYRSLARLDAGRVGFVQENLLLVSVRTVGSGDRGGGNAAAAADPSVVEANLAVLERIRERLAGEPGVDSVTYATRVPGPSLLTAEEVRRSGAFEARHAMRRSVGPHYLRTLGLAVSAGRELDARDRGPGTRAALVNRSFAEDLFGGESPLGQPLQLGKTGETVEIVGVAPDAFYDGPSRDRRPAFVFVAEQQFPSARSFEPTFFIRHRTNAAAMASQARRAVAEVDSAVPVVAVRSMAAQLRTVTEVERSITALLAVFALFSLAIAAIGQYAIAAVRSRHRARDFGVRMALGAAPRDIGGAVARETLGLAAAGLMIGLLLSAIASAALSRLVPGIGATDVAAHVAVLVVTVVVSLGAAFVPAVRAGRVNVMDALRQE